ncbi:MBOAT family O-acyltransferase [uncultured Clostridium sp.]|jgi:alginate O-acetyltransferase complex protein AlgI|uniref:MBOAT family O-acyltransferase n=1 Tax=uncultured Clostridium sp. TaxID=59620 RepID=UPI002616588C|nr:MBOAT family O-acyltransferase [uncultured Clostridium sp.]
MVFSSILFIFRFLPIALLLYYIVPFKYKNFVILVLSLFFYSWGEPKYFGIMIASILVDYYVGRGIERNRKSKNHMRGFLAISIIFNLGILIFFKYSNFFIDNINILLATDIKKLNLTLPLGISFYTFQTMTYSIDIYRGKVKSEKNIISFGVYVALFPQLIAGPIVRYTDIASELKDRVIDMDKISLGIKLFILGLARKVLIANNIGLLWNEVQAIGFENIGTGMAWLGAIAFTMQVYFDFSGYSLMARGLGAMLGFTFPQNFNYPFISKSISEFWRRWHMTLGNFFKEYLYIPLGGNRVNKGRLILNLLVVWALTGFWHGAEYNFILWGIYFFIFLIIEKFILGKYLEKSSILSHVYLIFVVLISFVIFSITDLNSLLVYFRKMFTLTLDSEVIYYLRNYIVILVIGVAFSIPCTGGFFEKHILKSNLAQNIVLMGLFFVSIAYLVDASYNPFLYFRF